MLSLIVIAFLLFHHFSLVSSADLNYLDYSIASIQKELKKKSEDSFQEMLILKIHVHVSSKYLQASIGEELANVKTQNCDKVLKDYKKLHRNCLMEEDFKTLILASDKYNKLYEVACLTVDICEELNPLESEVKNLEQCQLQKIADLTYQTGLVGAELQNLKGDIFEKHDKCIRDVIAKTYSACVYLQ